jgi:hypothetical protein
MASLPPDHPYVQMELDEVSSRAVFHILITNNIPDERTT